MKRIRNLNKYKLFLLLGSIFLIYMFSQKLFGTEQKITSISLEKIQGDVKNKLFDVLSANELTTKNELDQYITTSQNILSKLKDENQMSPQIIQPVTIETEQSIPPAPEPTPLPPQPTPESVSTPMPEVEPIPEEPIFGPEPMLEPMLEPMPIGPEPMMETTPTPTSPLEMPPVPLEQEIIPVEPIPIEQPIIEEEMFESTENLINITPETTGGTEIAEMIPPTPPMQEAMFPEEPEGMEP